jgi:hypothetical protein
VRRSWPMIRELVCIVGLQSLRLLHTRLCQASPREEAAATLAQQNGVSSVRDLANTFETGSVKARIWATREDWDMVSCP